MDRRAMHPPDSSCVQVPARGEAQGSHGLAGVVRPVRIAHGDKTQKPKVDGRDWLTVAHGGWGLPGRSGANARSHTTRQSHLEPPASTSMKKIEAARHPKARGDAGWKHPGRRGQEQHCEGPNPRSAAGTHVPGQVTVGSRPGSGTSPMTGKKWRCMTWREPAPHFDRS